MSRKQTKVAENWYVAKTVNQQKYFKDKLGNTYV